MKERIVINQDWLVKDMKAGVPELDKLFICQKVEQVPETFEELKELCEDLESEDVFITSAGDCIEYHGLQFWVSGTVCHETEKLMEKYDKAIKKYDKAIKKMGKSIDRLGKVVEKGLKELEDGNN